MITVFIGAVGVVYSLDSAYDLPVPELRICMLDGQCASHDHVS